MKVWTVNGGEDYSMAAPNFTVAAAAALLIGEGGVTCKNGSDFMPFLTWGLRDAWTRKQFGKGIDEFLSDVKKNSPEMLAEALESILPGSPEQRDAMIKMAGSGDPETIASRLDSITAKSIILDTNYRQVARRCAASLRSAP
ncbi:hypothetical protein [Alcanivorax sp. 1008]|uniref:hypothetical protein n=1 Tax=Alcanivorax sp. 1008 TaxID=2816853 RepID=UPI001D7A923B|nr:hypothetical protein [Alcanivorax sp. 1008]MCC1496848.1 hypothetical protein [Alcanivorax sp. 1008]